MANPQAENGHVDLAHEIIEAMARYRIPGEQMQCVLVVWRKTYGWHKTEDAISLSQFVQMTGLKRPAVVRALNALNRKNIIIKKDNESISIYKFNKNFETWQPLSKKITFMPEPAQPKACLMCGFSDTTERHHIIPQAKGGSNANTNIAILCPNCHALVHSGKITIEQIITKKGTTETDVIKETNVIKKDNTSEQKVKNALSKKIHTKETPTKETTKEKSIDHEETFKKRWAKYPNKDGRKEAFRHFKISVKTEEDVKDLDRALDNYIAHLNLKENSWKRPKNGSTWFNNWRDWVQWQEPLKPKEADMVDAAAQEELLGFLLNLENKKLPSSATSEAEVEFQKFGIHWLDLQQKAIEIGKGIFNVTV